MAQKITERKPHAPPLVSTDQNSLTRSGQSLWVLRAVPLIASVVTRVFQTTASEIFYIINSRSCRWRWLSGKNMNYCTWVTLKMHLTWYKVDLTLPELFLKSTLFPLLKLSHGCQLYMCPLRPRVHDTLPAPCVPRLLGLLPPTPLLPAPNFAEGSELPLYRRRRSAFKRRLTVNVKVINI